MNEATPAPASDNAAPARASDKADQGHMIPKARLDEEIGKRRVLEEQVSHMAQTMLEAVPDRLRVLIPDELSPAGKVAWYLRAKETGVFEAAPVPTTDTGKPRITPKAQDLNELSPHARIAAGYRH